MEKIARLSNKNKVMYFVALIALGILVQIGAIYIMNGILMGFASLSEIGEQYSELSDSLTTLEFKQTIQVILISPVLEELVFRFTFIGLVLKMIRDIKDFKGSFWSVNIVASIMFGIYHWNIVQFVYATILGLMLGFIFYKMGGYLASLIVHMVINTAGLYLTPYLPENLSPIIMCILGCAVMGIAIALLIYTYKKVENI